jgi:hypothetical protein
MGRDCSTNGGEEECIYAFGGKVRRQKATRKVLDIGSRIVL